MTKEKTGYLIYQHYEKFQFQLLIFLHKSCRNSCENIRIVFLLKWYAVLKIYLSASDEGTLQQKLIQYIIKNQYKE